MELNKSEIIKLRDENVSLYESLREKDSEILRLKQIILDTKYDDVNIDFQSTKKELEQYKNHLEEVIKERTIELKNSEMRFLTLSDSLTGGAIFEITLTKDDTPWIGYMSKTIATLLEFDVSLIQTNLSILYDRIHPNDLEKFSKAFMYSKNTKAEFNIEIRYLIPGKPIKWLHFKANAIEKADDYTVWVGIIIETTDKNIFHQEIEEREAILNAIIENIPYDFWARDGQLKCFLQNSASKKMWGDMIGKYPDQIPITKKENLLLLNQINRVIHGEIVNEEVKLKDINGIEYDIQTLLAPILLQDKLQGVLCLNIDITDRKQVEKALIQNEEKFRNIFDSSTDAILIHSKKGDIIEMNNEFKKLVHYNSLHNEKLLIEVFPKSDIEKFIEKISSLNSEKETVLFETEITNFNNEKIPVEIKSKEIEYLGSKAVLSLIQNTIYRKKFERQLVTTIVETEERERARFASDLHDDLGPILSSMKMLTGLLVDTKDFNKIKNISSQVLELVSESIRSVRETSNSISPHILKNYGIIAATRNIIESFRQVIEISIETNCESMRFESTTEIIYYRVMRELLNNTLKHANASKIKIKLLYCDSVLKLEYHDDGVGFNVKEKLKETSTGLGLYNILGRIKSLESKYTLESKLHNGVLFTLETKIPN